MENDTRNVTDEFKGVDMPTIIERLDDRGIELEIAVENLERDFNMGTIIRSANAFGVRHVHIIGSKQWNKRGAMMTDKYLHLHYHKDVDKFYRAVANKTVIAIDNVAGATPLADARLPRDVVLVFGAEGPGLSRELRTRADATVAIEQLGSTRSINVGVAAGIVMYEWLRQHRLSS